jgi:microcompartment protein CcmK/EutM
MELGKVIGKVWLSSAEKGLKGAKLLIVAPIDPKTKNIVKGYDIAVDIVDAGVGDIVFVCRGSAVRQTRLTELTCTDTMIEAVVDHIDIPEQREPVG